MSDTSTTPIDPYNRNQYIKQWSDLLKCKPTTWDVGAALINDNRNYMSAMSVVFGLSWVTHKEYLKKLNDWFENYWREQIAASKAAGKPVPKATPEWLYQLRTHYITEIAKYPEN